jgi:hypothetical protein
MLLKHILALNLNHHHQTSQSMLQFTDWRQAKMADMIKIYDHATGEEIEREMNETEQAIRDKEVANWLAAKAAKDADLAAQATAKTAAEAKLSALGLTADDLKALGL